MDLCSNIGAIIGDIVGSRWEFNPTNDYEFEWLSDQNGYTDDTICTVAVADADTLGAIVGSISEAIWGIPKEIEQAIISFLTEEMKEVVEEFYKCIS